MLCVLCIIARSSPAGNEYPVATWKRKEIQLMYFYLFEAVVILTYHVTVWKQH